MENFRGIADESFPSFLANSLASENSGILENVTISSNLGLPVAASTVARNPASCENRYSDVQASYLEGRYSVMSRSSHSSQPGPEPEGRLASYQHDGENDKCTGTHHMSEVLRKELTLEQSPSQRETGDGEQNNTDTNMKFVSQGLSTDAYLLPQMTNKESKVVTPEPGKKLPEDDSLNISLSSFLENEKLLSLTSLEDSTDEDIDDEEFYDDHLEAYFEQLALPGMLREDFEAQELPESNSAFNLSENSKTLVGERTGQDCRAEVGDSSVEPPSGVQIVHSEGGLQQTIENQIIHLPVPGNGSCGKDGECVDNILPPFSAKTMIPNVWGSAREVLREENKDSVRTSTKVFTNDCVPRLSMGALVDENASKTVDATDLKLDCLYLQDMNSRKGDVDFPDRFLKQGLHSAQKTLAFASSPEDLLSLPDGFLETSEIPKIPAQRNTDKTFMKPLCDPAFALPDPYWSPTAERRACEPWDYAEKGADPPHNVVYQNEEGKWVTDLAYYTSFDKEQNLNHSLADQMNEDFRTGSDAVALIAQDEEEFEKEHKFMQEEKIETQNTSVGSGDTSWRASINYNLLRGSLTVSGVDTHDASYLRLSLGEFFGQRSEALGCLGGGMDVKRPSFGYFITSPEKREPVALLRQSDVSGGISEQDWKEQSKEQIDDGSTTFNIGELEAIPEEDKNSDATVTASNGSAEETLSCKSKPVGNEDKLPVGGDSMLSINTIATAIANASVSADPAQLAAMIMALSNKNKDKTFFPQGNKEMDLSIVNHVLLSNLEKSNAANTFDMEKYLKKTEVHGCEGDSENFSKGVVSGTWDLTLTTAQEPQAVHLLTKSLNFKGPEDSSEDTSRKELKGKKDRQGSLNASNSSKNKQEMWGRAQCSENSSDLITSKHSLPKQAHLTSSRSNVKDSSKDLASPKEKAPKSKFSSLKWSSSHTNSPENSVLDDGARNTERTEVRNSHYPEFLDIGSGEKPTVTELTPTMTPKAGPYSLERNQKTASTSAPGGGREMQDHGKTQKANGDVTVSCSNEKHVTFEKHFVTAPKNVDLKNTSPERDPQYSEDDQCSFRPSTSPLIHSSPSEVSATTISGSDSDSPSCTVAHLHRLPCDDRVLPPSVCLSPSMSRLTYISVCDRTIPARADIPTAEKRQSDATNELSTTIVRASPIPMEDQTAAKLKENLSLQSIGKGTSLSKSPSNLNKIEVTEPAGSGSGIEHQIPSPQSGNLLEVHPRSLTFNHEELGQVNLAPPGKPCVVHQAFSASVDTPTSCQDCANKAQSQGFPSTDRVNALGGLSGYIPLSQNASSDQPASLPSFKSHGSASEMRTLSAPVPPLLTGHSLSTAPFAQQYLGTLPSSGNVALPQYIGSSTLYGLPGFPCAAVPAEHIQNTLAMGIPLGQNVGSGLLGAPPLCNTHSNSLNQNLLNAAKPYPGQPIRTCGIDQWESRMTPGFGQVRVPEELKFPHACCVGIASQTSLSVFNPTDRWLQVSIGVLSVTVNGEKVDLSTYHCLVFKNKAIVGPHTTEDIKILFIPSHPGIFRCVFSVSSWPVSADPETIMQAEALATRVILTSVAENPVLEIETGMTEAAKTDVLDFGDLTCGSWKALPLKLINKTHATVPIRLIINANAIAWRCFTFSKEPVNASFETALQTDLMAQLAAPSVINHVMHASYDGQDPEVLVIWVIFRGPKKQISGSEILGPAEEFFARIDVEVDSPSPTTIIKTVALRARMGIARIHAPKDLQTVHLFAGVGSSTKQLLPLKNAGNIEVYLSIKVSDQAKYFSVEPQNLFLKPGEEQEVAISFAPKDSKVCDESILKILVQPSGPQYEVVLKGEVDPSVSKHPTATSCYSNVPPILSNKQFVAWGGVTLGRILQQKLALRNNSSSTTQHLRLLIRGQDQDCFQLQSTFGPEERLTSNREIKIRPKEDINIYLTFAPTRIACMLAKLEIKQLGIRSQPGIKFTIPLSGYGGTSNLILEDVKKLTDSYMVTLNQPVPGKGSRVAFSVRNTGSRAAYVKAVCFKDTQTKTVFDPKVLSVFPDKFVLKERTQEVVTLLYNPTETEKVSTTRTSMLSTVYFFCGDEVSRQQYRRALMHKPDLAEQILPQHSLLKNIKFDEVFQDEQLVTEVNDLPPRSNDIQLFYGNMHKITLSVIGDIGDSSSNKDFIQHSPKHSLEPISGLGNSERHIGNVSLDVLPVKGPQGPSLSLQTAEPVSNQLDPPQTWTVLPEHLILTAPSTSSTVRTGHLQISNNSVRTLKFELSWPAHCLMITPQHGIIEPQSQLVILVSPNSSLATNPSLFPWSGVIYIHCDNGQKVVKVQIREDVSHEVASTSSASKQVAVLSPIPETPITHMVKPITKPPSTKVEIKNRTITFPETVSGESSESYLELENHGNEDVKWHLSSFAPPYVKGVDDSGDVYRATYTAFRCSRISGTLEAYGKQKVAITFLPRDQGDYAQFWDLECHPYAEPSMKHTLRFQLSGEGVKAENEPANARVSTDTLVKTDNLVKPRRRAGSEASALTTRQAELTRRGVYAPEDVYMFLPTRVGESRTLKVNLRNNSFTTHLLKFLSPREPFYVKHSKYSLRPQHYINMPVQFKPKSVGRFEALLVVQTDGGTSLGIRLVGEALEKQ
ncbi:LOW QUALITY PROTEIN: centrosomal protein of 192 kDa [Tachyglossus aculeatus]|uniref:LOW QUALITY PROTEIN: centrosomal protein of 192 kDa n=1 Tax=Tachyglossus aculeatus TaxID=9261 RepID=UPI0018F74A3C|nr:LOW QUALITY PROTEIN: centrosomal protein of 192 kDa [Tachyglossus aculeatus]